MSHYRRVTLTEDSLSFMFTVVEAINNLIVNIQGAYY